MKRAVARAYREGWPRGGDRLGHQAAVQVLEQHGLAREDARAAATSPAAHVRRLLLEENVCRPGMVSATVQRLLPEIERRIRLEAAQAAAMARGVQVH